MSLIRRVDGSLIYEGEADSFRELVDRAVREGISLARANLADANLAGADLAYANLRGANFTVANLADTDLADANLRGADLAYANFTGANLAYANLADTDLRGANLRGANLAAANLADANLARANFGPLRLLARAARSDSYEFFLWSSIAGGSVIRAGCRTMKGDPLTGATAMDAYRRHVESYGSERTALRAETLRILDYFDATLHAQEAAR